MFKAIFGQGTQYLVKGPWVLSVSERRTIGIRKNVKRLYLKVNANHMNDPCNFTILNF